MFKPLRMSDTATVCSVDDPAIDWEKTAKEGESKEDAIRRIGELARKAPSKMLGAIVAKDGERVTEFRIGVIHPDEMGRINDECAAAGKVAQLGWRSFVAGLRGIEPWPEKPEKLTVGGVDYIAPQWIKGAFVRGLRDVAVEVGLYCWAFNRLTEEEVRF